MSNFLVGNVHLVRSLENVLVLQFMKLPKKCSKFVYFNFEINDRNSMSKQKKIEFLITNLDDD